MAEPLQYTEKVDKVIYGIDTAGFRKLDWIEMALAALDQAGMHYKHPIVRALTSIKEIATSSPAEEATP